MQSAGDDLISVAAADTQSAQALASRLRESGDWIEAVAGIDSVLVRYDMAALSRVEAERRLRDTSGKVQYVVAAVPAVMEIPVVYGGEFGPDLAWVCDQLDLSEAGFIALHTGAYTVDMLGFIPGFAYIGGLDKRLLIARLPEPRQHVPAGSVGIAGGRSGIYSLPGPGGWPLIGRTSRRLFDPHAPEPFALAAGMTVVFTAVDAL
jgi:KipI family sensor histidine kinase inhibitor